MLSGMDSARGALSGVSIAGFGGYLLGMVFPPAAVISPFIAMVGGAAGLEDAKQKEQKALYAQLEHKLRESLSLASRRAQQVFEDQTAQLHRRFLEGLESTKNGRAHELSTRIEEINESRKLDTGERAQKAKVIRDQLAGVDGVIKNLQSLI